MRTLKLSVLMLTATALLFSTGCNEKPGSKILAKVNGAPLTVDDLNFRPQETHSSTPQYGEKSIDDIINQELLFQQGIRLRLDQDPSYRRKLASLNSQPPGAKRQEMARRVFNVAIASKIDVGYQEGKDYYEKNAEQIATELHLLLVKFDQKREAEEALQQLSRGADFASIARRVTKGDAVQGKEPWDLGFVKWEQVPVDYLDRIYGLRTGEVSAILGSQATGFQIVKLLERRKVPEPGFQKVSAMVINRLRDLKLLKEYYQYLAALRKDAKIVTF
jgi:peptidyl-prolyl cis-trans isomerase C